MHLIQILLPLYNKQQTPFPKDFYMEFKKQLTDSFGGLTAYSRVPADGIWKEDEEKTIQEDIVVYEVMVEELDMNWWTTCKNNLEIKFQQNQIIIRASIIELI